MSDLRQTARRMADELRQRLGDSLMALYLYGSAAMEDFRPGWSDIDVLCLTDKPVPETRAQELMTLRERMAEGMDDPIYRSFEGAIVALSEFLSDAYSRVVYWGTGGERVTDRYDVDPFCRVSLLRYGKLLAGREVREQIVPPTMDELRSAVAGHLATIRQVAGQTGSSLYSCGWLLDISRCLYTLRTGDVLPKTAAGEWALNEGLCPVEDDLRRALTVRREPARYKDDPDSRAWLSGLAPSVQRYADVLEAALKEPKATNR